MSSTGWLIALIFVLFAALELLNALFEAFHKGHVAGLAGDGKRIVIGERPWLLPLQLLRVGVAYTTMAGERISLWLHELMHAAAQLLFLGRPRIVLCKNGGFAQAHPWLPIAPAKILFGIGQILGMGVISMAPALGMGALLYALVHLLAPLDDGTLARQASLLLAADRADALWPAAQQVVHALLLSLSDIGFTGAVGLAIGGLLLVPHLTPSSVDFYVARWALPANAAATLLAVTLYQRSPLPTVILLALGAAGVVALFPLHRALGAFGRGLATFLLSCGALGIVAKLAARTTDPALALRLGVAKLAVLLLVAATFYLLFLALFAASTLLTFQLRPIGKLLRGVPRELVAVFTYFHTCETCKLHYTRTCDGCGRTA